MELSALLISKFPFDSDLIITNYQKLKNIFISLDINKIKYCYFYRKYIHEIIFQEEETIFIENYNGVSFLFYLSLLIKENPDILNYSYSIDLIKNIVNINSQQNILLKQLIISKIILDLIYNYYGSDNCSEEEKNILEDIKNNNIQFIERKVTNIFNEFDLNLNSNDIKNKKIDLIYVEIICALIKTRKVENYEYTYSILNNLDLENIDITKNMYIQLSQLLNNNETYITDYIIINKEDLFNEKKINFYYFLIKYILKNSIYIYNIPFLLKTRKNIIKIIKTQKTLNFNNDNNNMKEKIEYVLKTLLDTEYYNNIDQKRLDDQIYNNVKIILNYYKHFLFESKKDIIISFENAIKDGIKINEDGLKDLEEAKQYNDRFSIINYIYNIKSDNDNIQKSEAEIKKDVDGWKALEKMIKDKKIKKIPKARKEKLLNYFNEENKKNIIKIFDETIYDFIMQEKAEYYNEKKKDKLKEILKYYKQYLQDEKKNDIIQIEEIINNNTDDYEKYLVDYDKAKNMNLKIPIINYMRESGIKEVSSQPVESWEKCEKLIKEKKIYNIPKNLNDILNIYFKDKNNSETLLQIFSQDEIDNFSRESDIRKDEKNLKNNTLLLQSNNINQSTINNGSTAYIKTITKNDEKKQQSESESQSTEDDNIYEKTYENIIKQILNNSSFSFHTNKKGIEPFILYDDISYGEHNISLNSKKFKKIKEYFKTKDSKNDLIKNFKSFTEFLEDVEKKLKDEFINDYNIRMKMKFQKNNGDVNGDENKDINDISVIYTLYPPIQNKKILNFKDVNILKNKANTKMQGLPYLILEINDENLKDIKYIEKYEKSFNQETQSITDSSMINKSNQDIEQSYNDTKLINMQPNISNIERNKADKMKIIEFKKIIGNHSSSKCFCTAEFIKELSNGCFISGGTDNRLTIYNQKFEIEEGDLGNINTIKEWTYSVSERDNFPNKQKNIIQYLGCSNKEMYLTEVDFDKKILKAQKYEIPTITCTNSVNMKDNNYVIIGLNGSIYFTDMFNKDKKVGNEKIITKTYRNALKINDTLLVLTSNKNAVNGEDALIFFDTKKNVKKLNNNFSYKIENFSFTLNTNGLALMYCDKNKNNRILLCACKKYSSDQKNGILLVNPKYEEYMNINKDEINKQLFYDTKEFEVYCFCPLFEVNIGEKIICENEDIISRETQYFLVGGYDNNEKQGKIKLYKLIYAENVFDTRIKFIQDIIFQKSYLPNNESKNFGGFEGAISCIIQSKRQGNILVSCYDSKIYLLSEPNLEFYLNKDKILEEKKEKKER